MKKTNKEIFRLAIPNILSNISVPLLSSVDTALMGNISLLHLGAVGVGSMIFSFIYWNFGFLRMGTTGMTAQAFGAKDDSKMIMTLARAIVIALIVAFIFIVFQKYFGQAAFSLMEIAENQKKLVATYFYIRIWAAPATLILFSLFGWYFGMQNPIYPLILTILINVVNIIFSVLFVRYWGWGVSGVAWGTVIAQYTGVLMGIVMLLYKYSEQFKYFSITKLKSFAPFKSFLNINRDIFIRTIFLTFALGFFYRQSSIFGADILAVNVILQQFISWMSYGVDGFAYATESLVGKYIGEQSWDNLKKVVTQSFKFGMGLAFIFSFIFWFFEIDLIQIFNKDAIVLKLSHDYILWIILFPIVATPSYIWDGVFIGYTASKEMRNSMAGALVIYLSIYYLLKNSFGNHGLWIALLLFVATRAIIQMVLYKKIQQKRLEKSNFK